MIYLDLTSEEIDILIDTLECELSDLRMEIVDTDNMEFRGTLKAKKNVLIKTLKVLQKSRGMDKE